MAPAQKQKPQKVTVTRLINAPQARVYKAWTDVEEMKRWTAPGPLFLDSFECDFRVGGKYRLAMAGPDGESYVAVGTYKVIDPPKKLVYTWKWGSQPASDPDSLVTVMFNDRGRKTEVVVLHEGLKSDAQKDHEEGWSGSLDKLQSMFA